MKIEPNSPEMIASGLRKLEWIEPRLRILNHLKELYGPAKPLNGCKLGVCHHIEPKAAVFYKVLKALGAELVITGSPGTTQDDVAMALAQKGITIFGRNQDRRAEHEKNLHDVLDTHPNLLVDNGADLVDFLVKDYSSESVVGATEETTSGANRLRGELKGRFAFPVIVINDSPLKRLVENQYGVGQTVVEGFMRATNLIIPGKRIVVIGYGWCGKGTARSFASFGARVKVVELDPLHALEAAMDGFELADLDDLLEWGQVFVTITGHPDIISFEQISRMQDKTILVNAGHFSDEIDLENLRKNASSIEPLTDVIKCFTLPNGRRIYLLADGEMINLASGKGNPAETMDMGLALQVLSIIRVAESHDTLPMGALPVPDDINREVAKMMLEMVFNQKKSP